MKKRLANAARLFFVVLLFCCFVSCDDGGSTDLPVNTIKWVSDGDNVQFYTNDTANCGYSFTHCRLTSTYDLQSEVLTAYIKKNSGRSQGWGYGLVFGRQDSDNYYYMRVTTDGWIYVGKRLQGSYSTMIAWEEMESNIGFHSGYGVENKVDIWEDPTTDNRFLIRFNNSSQVYYFDDSGTVFNSGQLGMLVVVDDAEDESFPNTPVDVRMRISSPFEMKSMGTSIPVDEMTILDEIRK